MKRGKAVYLLEVERAQGTTIRDALYFTLEEAKVEARKIDAQDGEGKAAIYQFTMKKEIK